MASKVTPIEKAAERLQKRGPSSFDSSGRRVIRHDPGHLPDIIDQIETALAEAPEQNIYRYAGRHG